MMFGTIPLSTAFATGVAVWTVRRDGEKSRPLNHNSSFAAMSLISAGMRQTVYPKGLHQAIFRHLAGGLPYASCLASQSLSGHDATRTK